MGDKQGHPFRGNQWTDAQRSAMDRMHDRAKDQHGHVIAAKHGVRYDPERGKFVEGPIPMSAESLALRAGRAERELRGKNYESQAVRGYASVDKTAEALVSAREAWRASGGHADDKVRAIGEKAIADVKAAKARGASVDAQRKILIKAAEDIKAAAHPDSLMGMHRDMGKKQDRPEPGKVYNLTAFASGEKSIAKGNTWAESEVKSATFPGRATRPPESVLALGREVKVEPKPPVYGSVEHEKEVSRERIRRSEERTKGQKAYARRKEREQVMKDLGLVKVKGARGGTYWE